IVLNIAAGAGKPHGADECLLIKAVQFAYRHHGPQRSCVPGLWKPRTLSSPTAVRAIRAVTSKLAASAAGDTLPLACDPVSGSHSKAPIRAPLASSVRDISVCHAWGITDASKVPPQARTSATTCCAHGCRAPTKPAPKVSSTAIVLASIRLEGRSANCV